MPKMNKRAQVATTITWIVATVIIIIMLVISMLLTAAFGKRTYNDNDLSERTDLFIAKSFLSYLSTKETSNVFEQISEQGNLNDFNGNLAQHIFLSLYQKDYRFIWLVVLKPQIMTNIYFNNPLLVEEEIGKILN